LSSVFKAREDSLYKCSFLHCTLVACCGCCF
jgi:hypothetical protein